jgi:hypothetical protein
MLTRHGIPDRSRTYSQGLEHLYESNSTDINLRSHRQVNPHFAIVFFGTPEQIRTVTLTGLSRLPLPLGYRRIFIFIFY